MLRSCRSVHQRSATSACLHPVWTQEAEGNHCYLSLGIPVGDAAFVWSCLFRHRTKSFGAAAENKHTTSLLESKIEQLPLTVCSLARFHAHECLHYIECVHAEFSYIYLCGEQLPKLEIKIFITGKCARKIQLQCIKPYGEVTETLSSAIKMLLPQSPPTHRLMNTHHLCMKFHFVLLMTARNLNK